MWSLVSCKSLPVTRDAFSTTAQLHYCDVNGKHQLKLPETQASSSPPSAPSPALRLSARKSGCLAMFALGQSHFPS